jgi:hypothetical protein
MADDFIAIEAHGILELQREIGNWPKVIQDEVIDEVNKYVVKSIKKYPPYRYVTFKQAYGGFFSDKQRKYVMARIAEGSIKPGQPNRTGRFAQGWKVIDKGTSSMIVNEVPYSGYLMGDGSQARMHSKIGWKTISKWLQSHMNKIIDSARQGLVKAVRKINSGGVFRGP